MALIKKGDQWHRNHKAPCTKRTFSASASAVSPRCAAGFEGAALAAASALLVSGPARVAAAGGRADAAALGNTLAATSAASAPPVAAPVPAAAAGARAAAAAPGAVARVPRAAPESAAEAEAAAALDGLAPPCSPKTGSPCTSAGPLSRTPSLASNCSQSTPRDLRALRRKLNSSSNLTISSRMRVRWGSSESPSAPRSRSCLTMFARTLFVLTNCLTSSGRLEGAAGRQETQN